MVAKVFRGVLGGLKGVDKVFKVIYIRLLRGLDLLGCSEWLSGGFRLFLVVAKGF